MRLPNATVTVAFGESSDSSSLGNPYRYTGRRLDNETGFYYYRARHYSAALGRFLQPDPLGYGDGMNLYAYVGNDPLNFVDPLGLYSTTAIKLRTFPFALSLSKGEWKSPRRCVKPFMVRQAHHERLNLMAGP